MEPEIFLSGFGEQQHKRNQCRHGEIAISGIADEHGGEQAGMPARQESEPCKSTPRMKCNNCSVRYASDDTPYPWVVEVSKKRSGYGQGD